MLRRELGVYNLNIKMILSKERLQSFHELCHTNPTAKRALEEFEQAILIPEPQQKAV